MNDPNRSSKDESQWKKQDKEREREFWDSIFVKSQNELKVLYNDVNSSYIRAETVSFFLATKDFHCRENTICYNKLTIFTICF